MESRDGSSIISFYKDLELQGVKPSIGVAITALKACGNLKDLKTGREIHSNVLKNGDLFNIFVANTVISMYAKCGKMEDAQKVFDGMPQRDTVSWNCMIIRYAQNGKGELALELHEQMEREGYVADRVTLLAALKACATMAQKEQAHMVEGKMVKLKCFQKCRIIHSHACRSFGQELDLKLASSLVDVYSKCGSMDDAYKVFVNMKDQDVISWNGIIAGYAHCGDGQTALNLFSRMIERGFKPDGVTYVSALKACAVLAELETSTVSHQGKLLKADSLKKGRSIHKEISRDGYEEDAFITNTLVDMYAKCGCLEDALDVFMKMRQRDVVSWNCIIMGCAQSGQGELALQLYSRMREAGCVADKVTFLAAVKACTGMADSEAGTMVSGKMLKVKSLNHGRTIHGDASNTKYISDMFLANSLIDMYSKSGSMSEACQIFDRMEQRDVVSWNCVIRGHAENGESEVALELYSKMFNDGRLKPDGVTVVAALKACINMFNDDDSKEAFLEAGRRIHSQAQGLGIPIDRFVASSLVEMYVKCGRLDEARRVMDEKHLVSWNSIITGYAQAGDGTSALQHFASLQDKGLIPDGFTYVGALQACSCLAEKEEARMMDGILLKLDSLEKGRRIHHQAAEKGINEMNNMILGSALVDMYAKCGSLGEAMDVFQRMENRDVISWTIIILGCATCGDGEAALRLYFSMQASGIEPRASTFVAALKACGCLGAIEMGRRIEMEICNVGLEQNTLIATSLVDFYGKSGSMREAERVFQGVAKRDIVLWNALITGYSRQGDSSHVFRLFDAIINEEKLAPDSVTFLVVLGACSHAGLVDEAKEYFESMCHVHKLPPSCEHYACIVDSLGRANRLEEALELILEMQLQPSPVIWISLLDACRKWKNEHIGKIAFEAVTKLDRGHSAPYMLMSGMV